jgi:hypothetical protein
MGRSGYERTTRATQDVIIGPMHHLVFTDEEMLKRLKAGGYHAFMALEHFKKLIARREVELLLWARGRGWAWHYIAALLGKSPQSVQQKWKRLTRDWD